MRLCCGWVAAVFVTLVLSACGGPSGTTVPAPAGSETAATPTAADQAKGSYRFERNGWIFVHLEGTPAQVGFQHG